MMIIRFMLTLTILSMQNVKENLKDFNYCIVPFAFCVTLLFKRLLKIQGFGIV